MKSIFINDFVVVGSVLKSHGTKGEIKISTNQVVKFTKWAFLEIREKPVPFLVTQYNQSQPKEWILKLDGINGLDQSDDLVGYQVLLPKSKTIKTPKTYLFNLNGFTLIDKNLGTIGKITNIEELPQQTMMVTQFQNKDIMIPMVEAFILEVDEDKEIIYIELPEGFLEL